VASSDKKTPLHVWLVGLGALAVGAAMVWIGGLLDELNDYDRSIFVHVGTAIALVGPLYVVERLLSRRIGMVGTRVDAVKSSADAARDSAETALTRVDELSSRVQRRLDELRASDRELRDRAATGNDQADLVALYDKAASNRSIDRLGLRIPAPNLFDLWLRVRVVHRAPEGVPVDLVELSLENDPLDTAGNSVVWSPNEPVEEPLVRLATGLQNTSVWQGDRAFDPDAILSMTAEALGRIIDIRTGPRGDPQVRQIASLVNESWAVTREGLDSLVSPAVWAEAHELVGERSYLAFQRLEHQVELRNWNNDEFREAFSEAERVHEAFAKRSPGKYPFMRGGRGNPAR
jgi:hypothetical protein